MKLIHALLLLGAQAARFEDVETSLTNNIKIHVANEGMNQIRLKMNKIEAIEKDMH